MKKYKVQWDYASVLGGPWAKGDVVELDEDAAATINRDSPGVLKPVREARAKKAGKDRMVRGGQDRSAE